MTTSPLTLLLKKMDLMNIPNLNIPPSLNSADGSFGGFKGNSSLFSSFSFDYKRKAVNSLGLNLLNSTIWTLKQHAFMVKSAQEVMHLSILNTTNIWESSYIAAAGEIIQPIVKERNAQGNKNMAILDRMSASSFLCSILMDKDVYSFFPPEEKLILNNAITLAWWKEGVEYDLMMQNPDLFTPQNGNAFFYNTDHTAQERFFTRFQEDKLPLQMEGTYDKESIVKNVMSILEISPWCGVLPIMKFLHYQKVPLSKVSNRDIRDLLTEILHRNDDHDDKIEDSVLQNKMRGWLSSDKRQLEDQFWLGKMAAVLAKKTNKNDEQVFLFKKCNQLKRFSQIIDEHKLLGSFTGLYSTLALQLQKHNKFDPIITKLKFNESISTEMADIISQTIKKVFLRALQSEAVVSLIACFIFFHNGIFHGLQQMLYAFMAKIVHTIIY